MDNGIKEYIDSKIGLIRVFSKESLGLIKKECVSINGVELHPNDKTTLNDFFEKEVTFLGFYDGWLQFQIGEDNNLFDTSIYTNEFKKIDENRIVTVHQLGTARDYNYLNGKWK